MPWSVRQRASGGARPPSPRSDPSPPEQPALDLAASQRECLDLDAELSAIALRTAERALTLSAAGQRVRDLASLLQEAPFLRRSGCDLLQGFLFSPPIAAGQFEELLNGPPQWAWTA
ncbi:MAG: hypothetical protein ACLQGJ_00610 [Candidatus Dormibacteria bacterium]